MLYYFFRALYKLLMSGVTNDIEPTLFHGNIALHAGTNPGSDGDGSFELEGTLYCDKFASYNDSTPIVIFDTSFTPTKLECNTFAAASATFSSPLPVSSGGIGTTSLPSGRILLGNGQSSVASSPALLYDAATATISCTNQTISGNLSVSGTTSLQTSLAVASGGTGNVSFPTGNVLYGNGTAAISQSNGFNWNGTTGTLYATNVSVGSNATIAGSLSAGAATLTTLNVSANGTFTEAVTVGTATAANHAVTKGYVDSLVIDAGVVSAGTGLTKTASVLSVNTTQPQIVSVGTLTGLTVSGTFTSTSTTQLSNTSNVITGSQGAVNLSGDLHLANGASNCVYFRDTGLNVPTFTNRSLGTKLVICPKITASSVDYAIGYESSNLWFSTTTTATGFKWYGGTNAAMTLSGTGVLTPSGSLCLTSALTSTRRNNTSTAWYNLGLMDATATADGTRVILRINGSSGYTGNTSFGGETVVNVSINNNTVSSSANLNGTFYSFGDTPVASDIKFVQNGGNRYSYYIYALMAAYPSMSLRATGPTGFIWNEIFTLTADPGPDSTTVKAATSTFSVNSPTSFATYVRGNMFLTGWGWLFGNGYGLYLNGGADPANFVSVKANSSGASPEMIFTSDSTVLKRNDGTTNSLYINNATGVITVDYALNLSAAGTIQGVTPGEFAQLANINSTSISNTQWAYLGALNQNVHSTSSPTFAALTATTGTFSSTVIGTSFSGNLIGGTVSGTTGTFSGVVTGTSFSGNHVGGSVSATTGTFSGAVTTGTLSATSALFSSDIIVSKTANGTGTTYISQSLLTSVYGLVVSGGLTQGVGPCCKFELRSNSSFIPLITVDGTPATILFQTTTASSSTSTGSAVFSGGVGIQGALYGTTGSFSGAVTATTGTFSSDVSTDGNVIVNGTTESTGVGTGAVVVLGGMSVAKKLRTNGGVVVNAGGATVTAGGVNVSGVSTFNNMTTFYGIVCNNSLTVSGEMSCTTAGFSGAVTGPSFSGNLIGGTLSVTTGTFSGITNVSNTTKLSTSSNTVSSSSGSTTIAGDLHLYNATNPQLVFSSGTQAAPSFTTRSSGTRVILYPNVSASSVDFALGVEASSFWFSTSQSTTSFKWYGGTTLAASLTGAGVLTLASGLNATTATFTGAVSGASFTGNHIGGTISGTTGSFSSLTESTSITTGAIVTAGGIGVAKNAYVGQTLYSTNGDFDYLISQSLNCNTLMFYSATGHSLTIQPGIIPTSYTLTYPPAPPSTDGCLTLTDTDGASYFQPPVLASVFSTTSSLNKCKIWSTTASVASGGAVTVFPTSDNLSTGTALFSTILFASATATVNTTTMSSVALTGLRSISVDRRTVIFNVTNPSGTAAPNATSVMVMIMGV